MPKDLTNDLVPMTNGYSMVDVYRFDTCLQRNIK